MTAPRPAEGPDPRRAALFGAFYATHWRSVAGYVARRVPAGDADDVIAQTFSAAWRRFEVIPPEPEDRLWLFGVARRMVGDHRGSSIRRRRLYERLVDQAPPPGEPVSFGAVRARLEAAAQLLGWEPKVGFPQVLKEMVRSDVEVERRKAGLS